MLCSGGIGDVHIVKVTSRDPEAPPLSYVKVSGGIFVDMTIHDFDMVRYLSGSEVEEVSAPTIGESPVSLCCRVSDVVPLGSHDMFLADILAVYVDETLMDKEGKLHLDRADLCAYAHGDYYALGRILGHFGFSAAKKKKKRKGLGM